MRYNVENCVVRPGEFYLNGYQILYVQRCDTEEGWIEAPLVQSDGKAVFNYNRESFAVVLREGQVKVRNEKFKMINFVSEENPFHVKNAKANELSINCHKVTFLLPDISILPSV